MPSTSEGPSFFAMLARLQETRCKDRVRSVIRMERTYGKWHVEIWDDACLRRRAEAPTLPLALARAAMMTTYEEK